MIEVAVVGLGAAGSAALSVLARAGVSAVGFDRFAPPHQQGSSHGETRLLRVAYAEGAIYAPMARRAIELWRALEKRTHTELFRQSGVVYAGPESSAFLNASLASAQAHGVIIDQLAMAERARLLPLLAIPAHWSCFAEREGGYVFVDKAIAALLEDARMHGADIREHDACVMIEPRTDSVDIVTANGAVTARKCIVAAGGWTAALLPDLAPHLFVQRKTLHWFGDPTGLYDPKHFRPFLTEQDDGRQFYGFPDCGTGVKVAEHTEASPHLNDPKNIERAVTAADTADVAQFAKQSLPAIGPLQRSTTCLYPMSADGHFIIDAVPGTDRVFVAAGLSGHGFKFAPVIGEAVANLAMGVDRKIDLAPFAIGRF